MTYHRSKKNKTYIIKPDNSCQGKGIMLTKTPKVGILRGDIVACVGARDGRATNNRKFIYIFFDLKTQNSQYRSMSQLWNKYPSSILDLYQLLMLLWGEMAPPKWQCDALTLKNYPNEEIKIFYSKFNLPIISLISITNPKNKFSSVPWTEALYSIMTAKRRVSVHLSSWTLDKILFIRSGARLLSIWMIAGWWALRVTSHQGSELYINFWMIIY